MEPTQPTQAQPAPLVQPIVPELQDPFKAQELTTKLVKEFEMWESWRRPFETMWNRIYRLFLMSDQDEQKTVTRAKFQPPIVFQVIETAVPKILNVIFGNDEFFDVVAVNHKDDSLAKVIKLLLLYQLAQANFFVKFMDFVKQLLLYGTSYFKIYWKVTRKWVWERVPVKRTPKTFLGFTIGEEIQWAEQKSYKVVERRPELDVLDVLDVFPDPDAQSDQEGRAVWIRSWISYDDLEALSNGQFPVYANIPDKDSMGSGSSFYSQSRSSRMAARGTSDVKPTEGKYELLERWGLEDIDGDGIKEETYIAILDRKTLIHADGNPFHHQKRPIVKSVLFSVPKEWFGIGLIQPVIPLVHELTTLRRQRLDNINLAINRMWSVNAYADIDLGTIVSTPGGIILRGENPGDIQPLDSPNVTDQNYTEAAVVQDDIENATAPKSIQGAPDSGKLGRTARGAQLIIGQALEKFGTAIKMLEETSIKKTLRFFHQLNLQFLDDDAVFSETGFYGGIFDQQVTPEMIRAEVNFNMKGISDMVGKESKINQSISYVSVFGKILSPQSLTVIAQDVYELMGFDPTKIELMQAVQPMPASAEQTGAEQAVTKQVQQNGASKPPTLPGVSNPGGVQ